MPDRIPRCVGVLGGMGPQATIQFMQRVVNAVVARDDSDHVPLLVDQNPQVPSRIAALVDGSGDDPAPAVTAMARRLETAGAEALVLPCNTAHVFAAAIEQSVSIPFLSMVELSTRALAAAYPGACVGILASPAVPAAGLFDGPMAAAGLTPRYAGDQDGLLAAIKALKRDGADADARSIALASARVLRSQGADVILVGCSEFSLLKEQLAERVSVLDSLDVLVEATVTFSLFGAMSPDFPNKAARGPSAAAHIDQSGSTTTREAAGL